MGKTGIGLIDLISTQRGDVRLRKSLCDYLHNKLLFCFRNSLFDALKVEVAIVALSGDPN